MCVTLATWDSEAGKIQGRSQPGHFSKMLPYIEKNKAGLGGSATPVLPPEGKVPKLIENCTPQTQQSPRSLNTIGSKSMTPGRGLI